MKTNLGQQIEETLIKSMDVVSFMERIDEMKKAYDIIFDIQEKTCVDMRDSLIHVFSGFQNAFNEYVYKEAEILLNRK